MEVENILEPTKWKLGNTFVILLENNSILFKVNKERRRSTFGVMSLF